MREDQLPARCSICGVEITVRFSDDGLMQVNSPSRSLLGKRVPGTQSAAGAGRWGFTLAAPRIHKLPASGG
jgi:hypothetical protein